MGKKKFFYRKPVSVKEETDVTSFFANFDEKPIVTKETSKSIQPAQKIKKPKTVKDQPSGKNPILTGLRYVYLFGFFALLSGFFYPLIIQNPDQDLYTVAGGIGILFMGLIGGILVFKGSTSENKQQIFLGLGLIGVSLILIFLIARIPFLKY